ncbi:hypothetical protein SAMD00019534_102360, partial [Acytostelium subglobosum LB1]|uniref:hypothetical protein n=1 Tax=Acytostelium subglobosum LB1 TaxID=1410327 RepID=UPI00064505E5
LMYNYKFVVATTLVAMIAMMSIASVSGGAAGPAPSALEDFIYAPDSGYSYSLHHSVQGNGYTQYTLNLTSGNWLDANRTSNPVWWHLLQVCIPDYPLATNTAFLWNEGGYFTTSTNVSLSPLIASMCANSNTVVASLLQNPNQYIVFNNNGTPKNVSEDGILAYSWRQFIANNTDPSQLANFPMARAVVRAMDAVQSFVAQRSYYIRVKNFVISGASKRGWAAWLAAAVDDRVKAVIPVVMPIGALEQQMNNHFRAYGGFLLRLWQLLLRGPHGQRQPARLLLPGQAARPIDVRVRPHHAQVHRHRRLGPVLHPRL